MKLSKLAWWSATGMVIAVSGGAAAQDGPVSTSPPLKAQAQAQAVREYWTPDRMATAQPRPIPTKVTDVFAPAPARITAPLALPVPGVVDAHPPGQIPAVENVRTFPPTGGAIPQAALAAPQAYGTAPTDPMNGPYAPFQRWTMEGKYLRWARSIHGKLFFTLNSANYVCSGTVIGRSTVATAGHCVSDGSATFATNFLFCPSYNTITGINTTTGCWAWDSVTTSSNWHSSADPDYDYACIVTSTTGTVVADKIGNVSGTAGRAFNWPSSQPEITFGYPAAAPFLGNGIQQTASVEWYDWEATAGGQVSKVIGSDLTGGASGGGWFLGWRAPGNELGDTDGNNATDPLTAGPYINGVNSHKRCVTDCRNPPIASAGVFWQEMTSPPFQSGGVSDSEAIFADCLAHANNNP